MCGFSFSSSSFAWFELALVLRVVRVTEHHERRPDHLGRAVENGHFLRVRPLGQVEELAPGGRLLLHQIGPVDEAGRAPVLGHRPLVVLVERQALELGVDVLLDRGELRPVDLLEQPGVGEDRHHVAGRCSQVVAAGPALQLGLQVLVRDEEVLLDLDAGRLRERRVRLRVHVVGPVVVVERPAGLRRRPFGRRPGRALVVTAAGGEEGRHRADRNEALAVERALPDGSLRHALSPPCQWGRGSTPPPRPRSETRAPPPGAPHFPRWRRSSAVERVPPVRCLSSRGIGSSGR